MWWIYTYWWLENNNFWKAQVAFWVTILLSAALAACLRPWQAWKRHRETQEKIADRLDTKTPGGLADLVKALQEITGDLQGGDAPDDNGTDVPDEDKDEPRRQHDGLHLEHVEHDKGNVIQEIIHGHGGSSAGHR